MIGYKIAKNGDTRVVVTLEIPDDAQTNIGRSSVAMKETAKYRTNKAKVLEISDCDGKQYTIAFSFNYVFKTLTYIVGQVLEDVYYDPDPEKVCAAGIHFFLSRTRAELYGYKYVQNGLFQSWYDNGQKEFEVTYKDGKYHGHFQKWNMNGQLIVKSEYVNGVKQVYMH